MPDIQYSEIYFEDKYGYRHVVLPHEIAILLPKNVLLSEDEWRGIGVQQSRRWVHYAIHRPEPHIKLFSRPLRRIVSGLIRNNELPSDPKAIFTELLRRISGS